MPIINRRTFEDNSNRFIEFIKSNKKTVIMMASILLIGIFVLVAVIGHLDTNAQPIVGPIIVPLHTTDGAEYYTQLDLGYPEQQFQAQVALGQRYSWVFSKDITLRRQNKYDRDASASYTKDDAKFKEKEPKRTLIGQWSNDKARIANLSVESVRFVEITDLKGIAPDNYDAVIGISNNADLINEINKEHLVGSNVVSLHLNKAALSGELILGGVDDRFYEGDIRYVPLLDNQGTFQMRYIDVEGSISWQPGSVDVRTTTTTDKILVPPGQMSTLNERIKPTKQFDANTFGFEQCDDQLFEQAKDVKILVGEGEIILTPNDYIIKTERDGETVCESAFVVGNENYIWEFGTRFLKNYYTVYDFSNQKFGFAKSKDVE